MSQISSQTHAISINPATGEQEKQVALASAARVEEAIAAAKAALPMQRLYLLGHSLIGATPEVLVSRRGRVVTCRPLAGTTKRSADADQDREAGESLLHSTKNLAEHAFVTSWIRGQRV